MELDAGMVAVERADHQRLSFEPMSDSPGELSPPPSFGSAALAELYADDRREHTGDTSLTALVSIADSDRNLGAPDRETLLGRLEEVRARLGYRFEPV